MNITSKPFGISKDGQEITLFRMENAQGNAVEVLDYGCTLHNIAILDRGGSPVGVCLGYDTLAEYEQNDGYLGAVVGRFANRIGKGTFTLDGKTYNLAINNGANHLHGGMKGFDKYRWAHKLQADGIVFTRTSADGEEGYPGTLHLTVTYTFTQESALRIDYAAETDAATPLNLTNHCYFNLDGQGTVLDQTLQLFADRYTENDSGCLPTGKILPVAGTAMDFRTPKKLGRDIHTAWEQIKQFGGYDHNFVLNQEEGQPCAVLSSDKTGITMTVYTTMPGVQVYTGNVTTPRKGMDGASYDMHSGICLETQYFPDSMSHADTFPSPVLRPGQTYNHHTIFQFSAK